MHCPSSKVFAAKAGASDGRLALAFFLPAFLAMACSAAAPSTALADETPITFEVEAPAHALADVPFEVVVSGAEVGDTLRIDGGDTTLFEGTVEETPITVAVRVETSGPTALDVHLARPVEGAVAQVTVNHAMRVHVGFLSLLPALLAILMALLFRQVVVALFAGVFAGATILAGYDPLAGLLRSLDHYAVSAVADEDHAAILIFSLALGGMISVMTASGGAKGLAASVTKRATNAARGQLATWLLGVLVFFDDYANSLLVGSSMRPITDRLRISREKLAFIVDATAAPVSSLALVSSWIGVEVAYIGEQLEAREIDLDPYVAFLQTLPYRFYPWLMLVFGLCVVLMGRDFGPMRRAEVRARTTGKLLADGAKPASRFEGELPDVPARPSIAFASIGTVVLVALLGMYFDGRASLISAGAEDVSLRAAFGEANSIKALLWAACAGGLVAIVTAVAQKAMAAGDALESWFEGLSSMLLACVILVLAWSLGTICKELSAAQYLISLLDVGEGGGAGIAPFLPALVFVIAAAVSFATGSSWGTMAILFPLVVPLADELAPGAMHILLGSISSILAGSVFGDHCSPISDTTIMSSMASSCDHVDHVRTQLPYALSVGLIAVLVGEVGTGLGLYPAWVGLLLGAVCVVALVRLVGRPVDDGESSGVSPGSAEDATSPTTEAAAEV